jgi:hypothetical protein
MIQWAKPVVQLESGTPESPIDTGSPIFVIIPSSLWLGLSIISSLWLGARLKAKKEQKKILTWLLERAEGVPSRLMHLMSSLGKARKEKKAPVPTSERLYFNPRHISRTVRLEDGPQERTDACNHTSSSRAGGEQPVVSNPEMLGARSDGESSLGSGSTADGMEGTQLESIKPSSPTTHE